MRKRQKREPLEIVLPPEHANQKDLGGMSAALIAYAQTQFACGKPVRMRCLTPWLETSDPPENSSDTE